jgi:hypothetical protein
MAEFEKIIPQRLRQGRPVVLSIPKLGEPCHDGGKNIGVCFFQGIKKIPKGTSASFRFIKFYREFHGVSTSFLMYIRKASQGAVR